MSALPTGTITFLFTDVEGSTRLWEEHPQQMRSVMARHDALLTGVFEQHDGVVVRPRGEGDSLFAVFVRATDAVAAALAGQRALLAEDWGAVGPLRVRMGLHTGEADLREGDYYGSAVNRCARLRAAGHGGQVLLSQTTVDLVRGALPEDASLRELGRHRLRDLSEPEQIYQLTAPDLPEQFPPLSTLDARPHNLPLQLTSFLGRERELAEIQALLGQHRLLTLTGPGGTGKTRLALQAAAQVLDQFPEGVWFVDLSGVADPAGVVPAIAQVLNVRESEGRTLAVALAAYLRSRRLLLVIDNFEQVVDAALVLHDLLIEASRLSILVTSRVVLRVGGEHECPVPPLPLPPEAGAAELLAGNVAVQLFVARAQALRPDFAITAQNAAAIAAICRRLDGLPLAIELAAARVKLLPPVALLARLERRLPLLAGGARSLPARQQTLRATIQWSWDLLSTAERVLFRRLGVFAGGWTLEAAEAACDPEGEFDLLECLASLVDQSLVQQHEVSGEPRFNMLATLREFALEQLEAGGEAEAIRHRHASYFCVLAERSHAAFWDSGHIETDLLRPLDPERDNLFTSLAWSAHRKEATLGLRLAEVMAWWFYLRASGEGLRWLRQILDLPNADQLSQDRGVALFAASACAIAQADPAAVVAYCEEAAVILRAVEDLPWLTQTLFNLSVCLPATQADRALALADEALALAHATGGRFAVALAAQFAGVTRTLHGSNPDDARSYYETALRLARELGADWLIMHALLHLGIESVKHGQNAEARHFLRDARPLALACGDRYQAAVACQYLALLANAEGDSGEAAVEWRRGLALAHDLGSTTMMAIGLAGTAGLLANRQPHLAAQSLGAIERAKQDIEALGVLRIRFDQAYDPARAATRAALSEEAFERAWAEGEALTLDQAVAEALTLVRSIAPA